MKRVLIITYYWPPSGGAGVQRWLKFVKYLPQYGWEPVVIVPDPGQATYPARDLTLAGETDQSIRVIQTKDNSLFKWYKLISRQKNIPSAGFSNDTGKTSLFQKISRFVRGNFFLPDPRRGWNRHALKAAGKVIRETGVDVIITTGPPHSTHLIGKRLKKMTHIPWLADFRDPWTDIYYYRDFYPAFHARMINAGLERKVLSNADHIVTVSKGLRDILAGKQGCNEQQITVIPNGFDEEDFQTVPGPAEDHFTITYVGTLSDAYPIDAFVQAFVELVKSGDDLHLRFIGSVSKNQRTKLSAIAGDRLEYISYVDHNKAIEYMGLSNALLLVIPDHSSAKGILTGKLFEYIATGRPIVGIGPADGDAAAILKETNTGVLIDFNDKQGLSEAVKSLYSKYTSGDKSVIVSSNTEQYSRRMLTGQLVSILNHQSGEL
jgi:glycosyltransferase involved in cell wall biosynthesis